MSITSVIRYSRALDSAATDGSGKTGLAFGDITAKYLIQGGTLTSLTTETITTLGTYQAPTDASHIRIKELASSDPTKGVYEIHFHNTQVAASGVKLWLFLSASGAAFQPIELDLVAQTGDTYALLTNGLGAVSVASLAVSGAFTVSGGTAFNNNAGSGLTITTSGGVNQAALSIVASGSNKRAVLITSANSDGIFITASSGTGFKVDSATVTGTLTAGTNAIPWNAAWGTTQSGDAFADTETLLGRLTSARAGYLDNLNVGGNVASSAEVTAIQNNTRVVRVVPDDIELPASSTRTYRIELLLYDSVGNMEAPDSAPTIALVNQAGTDRSSRLDSTTMALVSTGRYRAVYTSTAGDTKEQLVWSFSVVEGGATRLYGNTSWITDAIATDFTSSDRANLTTIVNKMPTGGLLDAAGERTALGLGAANLDTQLNTIYTVAGNVQAKTDHLPSSDIVHTLGKLWVLDGSGNPIAPASATTAIAATLGSPAVTVSADIAAVKVDTGGLVTKLTTGITSLAQWLGLIAGKQTGNSTARTELRATGAGSGTFDETAHSLEALRTHGDTAWITATGFVLAASAPGWYAAAPTAVANADALLGRNGAGGTNGGKTVAYYIQGGMPNVAHDIPSAGYTTIYGADGTTPLCVYVAGTTPGADPVTSVTIQ